MSYRKLIGSAFWVLVFLALLGLPSLALYILEWLGRRSGETNTTLRNWNLALSLVQAAASIYTMVALKAFLTQYASYTRANIIVNVLIGLTALGMLMTLISFSGHSSGIYNIAALAFVVIYSLWLVFLGRDVSRCENSLFEYKGLLSKAYIGQGICTIVFLPLSAIFAIFAAIVLAMIFHKALEASEAVIGAEGGSRKDWKVMQGGQKLGPLSEEELFSWARDGRLKAVDLVWREGMDSWTPAGDAPELISVRSAMALPEVPIVEDRLMRTVLPVGLSGWAIAAGYLGLLSLLLFPAPFALFCGIMAVRDIRRNPTKRGMGRAIFGLVLGGLVSALVIVAWLRKLKLGF